jgi:hypothetical protein
MPTKGDGVSKGNARRKRRCPQTCTKLSRAAVARTKAVTEETGSGLMNPLSQDKAWSYVGRFIWGFAMIENQANQLFYELIGGSRNSPSQASSAGLGLLLTYSFDLRKKLELTQIILKERGVDESKMFKRLHQLHDLRNVITHFPFEEDLPGDRLSCDYINKYGETVFPKKPGTSEKDYFITYAEFDFYHAIAMELYDKLYKLWDSAIPITEDELQHTIEIEKAISSSDNVVRFPEKPQLDDED